MTIVLIAVLTSASVAMLVYYFTNTVAGEERAESRKIQRRLDDLFIRKQDANIVRDDKFSEIARLNRVLKRQPFSQKLYQLLTISGWTMPLSVFLLLE